MSFCPGWRRDLSGALPVLCSRSFSQHVTVHFGWFAWDKVSLFLAPDQPGGCHHLLPAAASWEPSRFSYVHLQASWAVPGLGHQSLASYWSLYFKVCSGVWPLAWWSCWLGPFLAPDQPGMLSCSLTWPPVLASYWSPPTLSYMSSSPTSGAMNVMKTTTIAPVLLFVCSAEPSVSRTYSTTAAPACFHAMTTFHRN